MVARPLPSTSAHPALPNDAQMRHELFQCAQRAHGDQGVVVVRRRLWDEWLHRLTLFVGCFHFQEITTIRCTRVL